MAAGRKSVKDLLAPRALERGPRTKPVLKTTHWRLTRDRNDVAWLLLDREGESANTLSETVMAELDVCLGKIEDTKPSALLIRSAKQGGFIAGADIRDFRRDSRGDSGGVPETAEVGKRMRRAHEIVDRLAALPMPTLAVIHGHCLGGGLELALACTRRIAVTGASFGFPEVLLGLHPGLGGTFRLPELIGSQAAMEMMLSGRAVHAKKALALGLVDALVEERHLENAIAMAVAKGGEGTRRKRTDLIGLPGMRSIAARRMRAEVARRAPEKHYPAPYRLIDLWRQHGGDAKAMQRAEIESFAELLTGETAQNLIRLFFLREGLKAQGKGDSGIAHVHVVGAGVMGGDIAAWCAARGLKVTLTDLDGKAVAAAFGRASAFFGKKLHTGLDRRDAFDRLVPDFSGDGVVQADLVIEAVAEKAAVKKSVYEALEPRMKATALLATNTSSIPLEELREGLARPNRFVGLHFFNPVTQMELVEVVAHDKAARATVERARAFCGAIGRLPAPVKSAPGFLVNRILTPYMMEALLMNEQGMDKETIDQAAVEFGMPMGPVELADRVGLDICLEVARMLKSSLPAVLPDIPEWLDKKVADGETGRKAGRGLYRYGKDGKPIRKGTALKPHPAVADRLILPMLNACVACLREGVVADEETLDAAVVFGTGFAPFRGGPLHYARERGLAAIITELERLQERYGDRFAPDPGWIKIGKTAGRLGEPSPF
ncbi:3-hydroxyacyl-CoA dehydrogenase NAD-binding domain-containing protein [Nitratireductor sp. ZSWI3]|uniref:3-hydroxyacyl-CoA dehydrogenase NAD-binding domain-containing protein n=1 Tax=Nitratireductor sp. ZSWI3 TaxID=2966359 RepID=UPI00214FB715|nr:3-hydroxyacyl-CoA dehydrogenase NAD-binding domain-containing protein [Nitratireductor sp. ZSWI3]MCR4267727.1 3-hydroxyacyl-CoA dehydrogenase NAD-binding domain-containing protein [Nitratireductor sp. ZSWI3]